MIFKQNIRSNSHIYWFYSIGNTPISYSLSLSYSWTRSHHTALLLIDYVHKHELNLRGSRIGARWTMGGLSAWKSRPPLPGLPAGQGWRVPDETKPLLLSLFCSEELDLLISSREYSIIQLESRIFLFLLLLYYDSGWDYWKVSLNLLVSYSITVSAQFGWIPQVLHLSPFVF